MVERGSWESIKAEGSALLDKLKQVVRDGSVRRVRVRHQGEVVAEFPLTAGVVGVVLAPVAAAIATIVALLKDCTIEVEHVPASPVSAEVQRPSGTTGM
jgi:hypothetical protein